MRFIHTADWHLGRLFHGVHLTDDQHHVLSQLVELVKDAKVDAVIVAGDVYDRAVPPPEAVSLLDEVLTRLVLDCRVRVVMIAGNHDGADRLAFGARILAERGLVVVASPAAPTAPIPIADRSGTVEIVALPYADPAVLRAVLGRDDLGDHDAAMGAWLDRARASRDGPTRRVLVAHAFVNGGAESESERPLAFGRASAVDVSRFAGYSYVALGHLHRPQELDGRGSIAYSGSLLKYSFAECDHVKSVSVVEIDERGDARIERMALAPRHDVRHVEGRLEDVVRAAASDPSPDDYLRVRLTDPGALFDPMGKLRAVHPNVLEIERLSPDETIDAGGGPRVDHRKLGDFELLEAFFREVTGAPLGDDDRKALVGAIEAARDAS